MNPSDFQKLTDPKILQNAFEKTHLQPEGCFGQRNSRKQAPCLKDEHPPASSYIVCILLWLRLLLLLFLGSVQLIK